VELAFGESVVVDEEEEEVTVDDFASRSMGIGFAFTETCTEAGQLVLCARSSW
jgi:hypothetical protein